MTPPPPDPAIYLAGPTGCGKSAVALALARRLGRAAIVNADAFQLYRGIDVLSAAPVAADRATVPHHLYGVLDLSENCDAVRYAALARPVITKLAEAGILPIVVGGSGLYLKALTHGLAPTPAGDPDLRAALDLLSLEDLVKWLQQVDPEGAARTNLKNRRYVTRNLEISLLSGRPASEIKQAFANPAPLLRAFVLSRERADLYHRIDTRAAGLFRDGALDEVRSIDFTRLSVTAEKAIGLREIQAHLEGRMTGADCLASIAQATRRYAKRQETWFRRETAFQSVCLSPEETPDSAAGRVLVKLRETGSPAAEIRNSKS
jgi:tRNA dimethylallyltransferase